MWVRQSTATTLVLGPFVDNVDGFTAETALTITNTEVLLSKNAGAFAAKSETTSLTHMSNGHYSCLLNTTDTNTLGKLRVIVNETGALPIWLDLEVVPAMIYDSQILGTDRIDVNITHALDVAWASGAIAAGVLASNSIVAATLASGTITSTKFATGAITSSTFAGSAIDAAAIATDAIGSNEISAAAVAKIQLGLLTTSHTGTAQGGTAISITLAAGASATNGLYDPGLVRIISGTGAGQTRTIIDYNGTSKVATVDKDWRTNPDATSVYEIISAPNLMSTNEGVAAGGGASTITLNSTAVATDNYYNGQLVVIRSGVGQDQVRIISSYVGSTKVATVSEAWATQPTTGSAYMLMPMGKAQVVAMIPDVVNASALASDAVTEIQTGLATSAALATVSGFVDTEVGAIKTVTDKLDTTLELDGAVYRYTTNALEQAPTGGGAADGSGFTSIPWNSAWDAEVQSEVTDALNAYDPPTRAELTTDTNSVLTAVDAVPTNAELATALGTADDAVLAQIALVKTKTDSLTFTKTNELDVNLQSVNDVTVNGIGTAGSPWGP